MLTVYWSGRLVSSERNFKRSAAMLLYSMKRMKQTQAVKTYDITRCAQSLCIACGESEDSIFGSNCLLSEKIVSWIATAKTRAIWACSSTHIQEAGSLKGALSVVSSMLFHNLKDYESVSKLWFWMLKSVKTWTLFCRPLINRHQIRSWISILT